MSSLPLLLAVMLASAPDGGLPEPTRRLRFDVPHAIDQVEVPEMLRALGVPVRLRAVRSSDKPEALMGHFVQAMDKAGLFIAPSTTELPGHMPHLTGLDVDNGVIRDDHGGGGPTRPTTTWYELRRPCFLGLGGCN